VEQVPLENIFILYYIYFILFIILFSLGSSLYLHPLLSCIHCNGSCSRSLAEGVFCSFVGIENGSKVTAIVNSKVGINGSRMNFIREGRKIPHTIMNVPSDGVYLGVCISIYSRFLFYSPLCYFPFLPFT
jgi:hypothetical protein